MEVGVTPEPLAEVIAMPSLDRESMIRLLRLDTVIVNGKYEGKTIREWLMDKK